MYSVRVCISLYVLYLWQQDGHSRTTVNGGGNEHYDIREKPTVMLYTYYLSRHAGTPDQKTKKQKTKKQKNNVVQHRQIW